MANKSGKCIVCGVGPTVKAHLFPRALMLDIRNESARLVSGSRDRDGVVFKQNGEWDDRILCSKHETVIGGADEYAVRFCRSHAAVERLGGRASSIEMSNPSPDLLLQFAYAVVWRHVVCASGRTLGLDMGRYETVVLEALLGGGPY